MMKTLKYKLMVLGALTVLSVGSFLNNFANEGEINAFITKLYKGLKPNSQSAIPSSPKMTQRERVEQVHQTCSKYKHLLELQKYKDQLSVYYTAPAYNWSYCKIGKIGSTFWTQFFYIMHHDGDTINNVLTKNREDIHQATTIIRGLKTPLFGSTRMILSARNPYTRLFSAYIDRMFIPSTSISIRGPQDHKCKSQITFSEFLQYVIYNSERGDYDYHWSPVFYLCKPCGINPSFVFKQENFKDDFNDVLNQTALEPYKMDVLKQAIRAQANSSTFAVVDDTLGQLLAVNIRNALDCQTREQITKRLWTALKIQGHISENAPFPGHRYKNEDDFKRLNIFHRAMIDAHYPLPKAISSLQRSQFLNSFYENIDPKIIKGIQEIYSVDFDMFGYSYDAPPWY